MVVNYISISVLYIFMLGCIQMMKNILCSIAALSFFLKYVLESSAVSPLLQITDSFERTLMMGKIEGGRRRGRQRVRWLDDLMDMSLSKLRVW